MVAAQIGDVEIVKLLLSRGAGVNLGTNYGWTAFMLAAKDGRAQVLECLLECPTVRLDHLLQDGRSARELAVTNEHTQVVNMIDQELARRLRLRHQRLCRVFLMGTHCSVGANSPVKNLTSDVLWLIACRVVDAK
eukprot:c19232_g1_i1.p1 GENE.c19232_g1_i1~~c19232_g1_i1.p1  ORF type:complete len:135 (+),score=27.01 c19232_g1_i1:319-723(+)